MIGYILYRCGQTLAIHTPLPLAYRTAIVLSRIHRFLHPQDTQETIANLSAIFPLKSKKEIVFLSWKISENFAKYLVDFFRFQLINTVYINRKISIVNKHILDEALKTKRGIILLTAHIGNWELGGVVFSLKLAPLSVVALSHKSSFVNSFFNAQRESKGMRVIQVGKAVKRCIEALRNGQCVAFVGDRDFSKDGGACINFFGKPTIFPKGPASLALKTGSLIIPGFLIRKKDDSYALIFEKIIEPYDYKKNNGNQRQSDKNTDITALIQAYSQIIEAYIRAYPDQWFMFKRFWMNT